jgi:hypothetical protein
VRRRMGESKRAAPRFSFTWHLKAQIAGCILESMSLAV